MACLKDLKRWLKLHDERLNRLDVARCLAEANVVNGDLLEIVAAWSQESMESKVKMKIALAWRLVPVNACALESGISAAP